MADNCKTGHGKVISHYQTTLFIFIWAVYQTLYPSLYLKKWFGNARLVERVRKNENKSQCLIVLLKVRSFILFTV